MKKRGLLLPLLSLALVAAGVWLYFTPYLALRELQAAAEAGDTEALGRHVDFPSLRESATEELRGLAERSLDGERRGALAAIGGVIAGALARPVVDAVVTPSGIAALTRGERPDARGGAGREAGRDSAASGRLSLDGIDVARGYEAWDRFAVHYRDADTGADRVTLLLRRESLVRWRLYAVRFGGPRDAAPPA